MKWLGFNIQTVPSTIKYWVEELLAYYQKGIETGAKDELGREGKPKR